MDIGSWDYPIRILIFESFFSHYKSKDYFPSHSIEPSRITCSFGDAIAECISVLFGNREWFYLEVEPLMDWEKPPVDRKALYQILFKRHGFSPAAASDFLGELHEIRYSLDQNSWNPGEIKQGVTHFEKKLGCIWEIHSKKGGELC